MATQTEILERLTLELASVVDPDLRGIEIEGLRDDSLCEFARALEGLGRLVDWLRVATAGEVEERSRFDLGSAGLARKAGYTRGRYLLERLTLVSAAEANRRIRLGQAVRSESAPSGEPLPSRFPVLSRELAAGGISVDAAGEIVRCLNQAQRTATSNDLVEAEVALVETARSEPADCVADLARALRDRLDPDGVLPREDETRIRRGIRLGRERNGVTPISGALEPVSAALLKSAFSEANAPGAQPRFLSEQDRRDGTETLVDDQGVEIVKVRDIRTRDQRQHDVFAGLLKAGVRSSGLGNGEIRSTADVTAVILLSDLEKGSGPGWLEGVTEPVSASTVDMLACDAMFRRLVLGNDGEVLYLGRTQYPFNAAQRRALVVRDGGCVWEDCEAPASWCDIHHVQEFNSHGGTGKTDIDNAVLLCAEHHQFLHHSEWQLRTSSGKPELLAPFFIDPGQTWRWVSKSRIRLPDTG